MSEVKPLYTWSLKDAVEYGEVDQWRESYKENCDCAREIERTISSHYRNNILEDCANDIIGRYGFDRVNYVLANTVQQKYDDGRISPENKAWARKLHIPKDDVRWHFCVESHPGLTDLFLGQIRRAWEQLGLFDNSHCVSEQNGEIDYRGKLLALKPTVLKEDSRTPDNQLFLASGGFGCAPNSRGRKVFGRFLNDGEETHFYRGDFIGAVKDEFIPEWAAEKLAELDPPDEAESEGITMGGM